MRKLVVQNLGVKHICLVEKVGIGSTVFKCDKHRRLLIVEKVALRNADERSVATMSPEELPPVTKNWATKKSHSMYLNIAVAHLNP